MTRVKGGKDAAISQRLRADMAEDSTSGIVPMLGVLLLVCMVAVIVSLAF